MKIEEQRAAIQAQLDGKKTQTERNRLGQFATPPQLARDIIQYGLSILGKQTVRFLDPAFGMGSFYSALLEIAGRKQIKTAQGFEIDPHYGQPSQELWRDTSLVLNLADFTQAQPPLEKDRFNLLICNPPYVRHHHLVNGDKLRLHDAAMVSANMQLSGLTGLYCYFIGIAHQWMAPGAIAGWLIPSEFMDVNYGSEVKHYLLDKVTLLRIHRFDPNDVQFDDALVSSAVVWFRNEMPPSNHTVDFTFGGSLLKPHLNRAVSITDLESEVKWSRFPKSSVRIATTHPRLSDFFAIKRGIATGDNKFFIIPKGRIDELGLPLKCFRPVLPSPRYVTDDEVHARADGSPALDRRLYLLDCRLPETEVAYRYPSLWKYLERGKQTVAKGYLCRSRKLWYAQEDRPAPPLLCTYIGRTDTKSGRPFRFILNESQATAANVYLLLYPKPQLARALAINPALLRDIWKVLNNFTPEALLGEGRVYGGGLHKLEPKELANVDATAIAHLLPNEALESTSEHCELFDTRPALNAAIGVGT